MNKPKAFIDFDGTICDSVASICEVYADLYSEFNGYIKPNPKLVSKWDMGDQLTLIKGNEIETLFSNQLFFAYLEPFSNAIEILKEMQKQYQIIIVSIGTFENISKKSKYIAKYIPCDDFIGMVNQGCKMDKSLIRMEGTEDNPNIFIDDHASNLLSQSLTPNLIKYCYADKETEWNKQWLDMKGRIVTDWLDIRDKILINDKNY